MKKIIILIVLLSGMDLFADTDKTLKVNINVPMRCMFGDFDAMHTDMMHNDLARVILSVYPLANPKLESAVELFEEINSSRSIYNEAEYKDFEKMSMDYYQNLFSKGLSERLALKGMSEDVYVISICNDPRRTNSCNGKEFIDINEIIMGYASRKETYVAPEAVYFYQLFKAGEDPLTLKNYQAASLQGFINEILAGFPEEQSGEVANHLALIKSEPLTFLSPMEVSLSLPHYDEAKCQGSGK